MSGMRIEKTKDPWGRLTDAKKGSRQKFQIQNNLAPVHAAVFCNRFKQRLKRAKTVNKTATETYTQMKRAGICFACALHGMFSGLNGTRKAAWLKFSIGKWVSQIKGTSFHASWTYGRFTILLHKWAFRLLV